MDRCIGVCAVCRAAFLSLFRGKLPQSEDVFHERAGGYEVVAVHERGPETENQENGAYQKGGHGRGSQAHDPLAQ